MQHYARLTFAAVLAISGFFGVPAAQAQSITAQSQTLTRLSGIVTDSLGNPVADAQVEIAGPNPYMSTIYCRTAADGSFMTDSLVVGTKYTIAAMRLGYRAAGLPPFVVEGTEAHVRLVLARRTVIVVKAKEQLLQTATRVAPDVSSTRGSTPLSAWQPR